MQCVTTVRHTIDISSDRINGEIPMGSGTEGNVCQPSSNVRRGPGYICACRGCVCGMVGCVCGVRGCDKRVLYEKRYCMGGCVMIM